MGQGRIWARTIKRGLQHPMFLEWIRECSVQTEQINILWEWAVYGTGVVEWICLIKLFFLIKTFAPTAHM